MKKPHSFFIQPLMIAGLLLILNWSCKKEDPPTLTTLPAVEITGNTAQSGGNITDDGGAAVTSRGVVWSTSENPTMNNNEGLTSDGTGDGQFVSNLTGLTPGTTYYIRAYAVNSAGTAYGNQEQFKTIDLASVTTAGITDITSRTATSGGNVMDDGGAEVTDRGVVWGTSENPTVDSYAGKTTDGSGTGSFVSELTGLNPVTTYYVRAYATNPEGTSYGEQAEFKTDAGLATVTTNEVTEITTTSARSGGKVTDDGGAEVTSRGVVWSTSENPDIDDNDGVTIDGSGLGEFTSELTELLPATTYFVRAYVTNNNGTSYGESVDFTTEPFSCGDSFTDLRDGTIYGTVQIGDQCWLKENLKYLPEVSLASTGSETEPHYYVYDYQGTDVSEAIATDNYQNYGVLYNWPAAMNGEGSSSANPSGVKGACPAGWHLPSDGEWTQLTNYLNGQHGIPNTNTVNGAGNALKSCRQVDSALGGDCATSDHPRWNSYSTHYGIDQFGFSALPGGSRYFNGTFSWIGTDGLWWSSTEHSSADAWYRLMYYNYGIVNRIYEYKGLGFSVRCVLDVD